MKKIILFLGVILLIVGCNNKKFIIENNNKIYQAYKKDLKKSFINQFPDLITQSDVNIVYNTNKKKNDIGLLLYEFDVDFQEIKKITNNIKYKAIVKYTSKDTCLLVVNRFETNETYRKFKVVDVTDSLNVNTKCSKKLYPIPNFIEYDFSNKNNDLKLSGNFDIYVLESKSGNHFKEFDLLPNPQMPKEWENGYSKGIAISKEKKTLIYWSIIW